MTILAVSVMPWGIGLSGGRHTKEMELLGLVEGEANLVSTAVPDERLRHEIPDLLMAFGPGRIDSDGQSTERIGVGVDGLVDEPTRFHLLEEAGGRGRGQSLLGQRTHTGLVVDEPADLERRSLGDRFAHVHQPAGPSHPRGLT